MCALYVYMETITWVCKFIMEGLILIVEGTGFGAVRLNYVSLSQPPNFAAASRQFDLGRVFWVWKNFVQYEAQNTDTVSIQHLCV